MAVDRTKVLETAQKHLAKGQLDKAIAELLKIVKDDPQDVRTWLKIGDIYTRKNANKEAIETYGRVAETYAKQGFFLKAVAVYKQILKLDPNLVDYSLQLADMYEQLALISDALTTYEQVAATYTKNGDTEKALQTLSKMAELDPENIPVRIKFAEALSKANKMEEAAEAFAAGAQLLKDQGRLDDYLKVAERLLFHRPDDTALARELAEMYLERDDAKRALSKLQVCFKADPRDIRTLELLAKAFGVLGQTPKTISVYREIAKIHHEAGRNDERAKALKKILELDPNDAEARQSLAGFAQPQQSVVVPPGAVIDSRGSGARSGPMPMPPGAVVAPSRGGAAHAPAPAPGPARVPMPAPMPPEMARPAAARPAPQPAAPVVVPKPAPMPMAAPPPMQRRSDPDQSTEIYIEEEPVLALESEAPPESDDLDSLVPPPPAGHAAIPMPAPAPAPQMSAPPPRARAAVEAPLARPPISAPLPVVPPPAAKGPPLGASIPAAARAPAPAPQPTVSRPAPIAARGGGDIPPEVAREAQIARLLTECDVFMRYGLKTKVVDQLRRILDIDAKHVEARERLKDMLLETGDLAGAVHELIVLADTFVEVQPDTALLYLRQAQEIDPEHPDLVLRLGALAPAEEPAAAPQDEAHEELIAPEDDDDAPMLDTGDVLAMPETDHGSAETRERPSLESLANARLPDFDDEPLPAPAPAQTPAADDDDVMFVDDESAQGRASDEESTGLDAASNEGGEAAAVEREDGEDGSTVFDKAASIAAIAAQVDARAAKSAAPVAARPEPAPPKTAPATQPGHSPFTKAAPQTATPATGPGTGLGTAPAARTTASLPATAPATTPSTRPGEGPAPAVGTSPGTPATRSIPPSARQSLRPPGAQFDVEDVLDEADFFVTQGLYEEARQTLSDALAANPTHPLLREKLEEVNEMSAVAAASLPPPEPTDDSFELAEKLAEELGPSEESGGGAGGDILDVEEVFAQFKKGVAEQIGIEDSDTHFDLGIAYKEMGLLDDAIHEFGLAMSNPQRECAAQTMIGLCYVEKGSISDAITHFKKGLYCDTKSDREELGLYFELGIAYELLHDAKEALYYYQKVQKRDPTFRQVEEKIRQLAGAHPGAAPEPSGDDVDRAFDDLMGGGEKA